MMRDGASSLPGALPLPLDENADGVTVKRSIGEVLLQAGSLTRAQLGQAARYQRANGGRFGEAAVALGLLGCDEVLWALSQQFRYPYARDRGQLGRRRELVVATDPFGAQSEAFRDLRSRLLMDVLRPDLPRRALGVVSPDKGDGKTFFAANMAVALSQLGHRTVLVDADMRTPRQHEVFGVDGMHGLSGLLSGHDEPALSGVVDLPSLYVLPVGIVPPNPLELVQGPAFCALMERLLQKFDHVVVDTPAAVHGADVRVIAAACGAALAIARPGQTRMTSMEGLIDSLRNGPAMLAGVVMNQH
jgi:chain length determinant protein tyrosine kinase EpsG